MRGEVGQDPMKARPPEIRSKSLGADLRVIWSTENVAKLNHTGMWIVRGLCAANETEINDLACLVTACFILNFGFGLTRNVNALLGITCDWKHACCEQRQCDCETTRPSPRQNIPTAKYRKFAWEVIRSTSRKAPPVWLCYMPAAHIIYWDSCVPHPFQGVSRMCRIDGIPIFGWGPIIRNDDGWRSWGRRVASITSRRFFTPTQRMIP